MDDEADGDVGQFEAWKCELLGFTFIWYFWNESGGFLEFHKRTVIFLFNKNFLLKRGNNQFNIQYANYKFTMSNVSNFQKGVISLKESVLEFALFKNSNFFRILI